jgi:large conductance mechanosensitive channel
MLHEFKKFALRGNVMGLAVGIVIGAAFTNLVTALVDKVIMPVTGALTGGINFADRTLRLSVPGLPASMQPEIGWGAVVQASLNFVIVAFVLFMIMKGINSLQEQFSDETKPDPVPPPEEIRLLREIRDALTKPE